jgi:uncharacterized protein (TIGR02246 family)
VTTTPLHVDAAAVAREVLDGLETAWNRADGRAFGAAYAPGASFVTIRGEHVVGATVIAAGHAAIFGSIYAGSTNRMALLRAHEVAEGVVLAVSESTLDCPAGPLAGVHRATSTSVLVRDDSADLGWRVVSTHNTLRAV